jgi:ribosome-associated translation inhibitor RaiA
MEIPLQITFRAMPHSDSLETHVRRRAAKLDRICQRLMSCRVVLEAAHRRHRHGKRYRVCIDLGLPRGEIAVSHAPGDDRNVEDAHAIVDEAFDEAVRSSRSGSTADGVRSSVTPSRAPVRGG